MILDISFNQGFFKHIVLGQYTKMDRAAGFAYVILLQNLKVLVHWWININLQKIVLWQCMSYIQAHEHLIEG